jgi:hypothetical protein
LQQPRSERAYSTDLTRIVVTSVEGHKRKTASSSELPNMLKRLPRSGDEPSFSALTNLRR